MLILKTLYQIYNKDNLYKLYVKLFLIFCNIMFFGYIYSTFTNKTDWMLGSSSNTITKMDFWTSCYFSLVSFTTIGFGDISPFS